MSARSPIVSALFGVNKMGFTALELIFQQRTQGKNMDVAWERLSAKMCETMFYADPKRTRDIVARIPDQDFVDNMNIAMAAEERDGRGTGFTPFTRVSSPRTDTETSE